MRIHANDDVYETTKHRMAVAEENQKNKCTREIKPNQTDIGRRVKLKPSSNRLSNIPSNSSSSSTSSITPYNKRDSFHLNSAASASNSTSVLNSSSNNLTNNHGATSASSPSLKATNGMTTGSRSLGVAAGVNGGTQVFGSGASRVPNRVANRSNQSSSSRGGNPDIMKRSIKRKPQNLTPPLSSDGGSSTSGQSPTSTHNGSPPPAVKRPAMNSDKFLEGPVSKKTRISRVGNANHDARRGMTDSRDSANMNPRSREHHDDIRSSNSYYGSNSTPTTQESEDSGLSLSYSVLRSDAAQRFLSSSSSSADTEAQHHHRQFRRIESIEQRREYKSIFDKEYAEYRKLHADIDQVSKKFAELEEALRFEEKRLRREERDDLKYRVREIQKRILNEYKETMRNRNHLESKKRFQYLHQKLSHIKKLVNEFDLTLTNGNGILTHSGY
uniref:OCEL domain-containing protein n=2 Tax=Lutzomyia longipalpis TaxID=7200 RepID=A0A1B0GKA4_LUTLO